jgi:hypothetical protein
MDKIKQYLEAKVSDTFFFEEIYNSQDLQSILDNENDIPPYTNNGSLLLFLLSGNTKDLRFIINAKDALKQFLQKNKIDFHYSEKNREIYNLILDVQPKWLDVQPDFFSDIIKNYNGENKKEIKEQMKERIQDSFISIKSKPKWLQNPNWPIEDGEPLIFIGELDMSDILHDTSKVFIFYSKKSQRFQCIKQSN